MEPFIYIPIALILGVFLGFLVSSLKFKSQINILSERLNQLQIAQENQTQNLLKIERERDNIRLEKERLIVDIAEKNSNYIHLKQKHEEQKGEIEKLQEKFTEQFENLANRILEEKSEKFALQNKESLKHILNPLQEKIQGFEKRVEDTQKENISMHSALKEQLHGLKDLNQQITKEASNLTRALKGDNKMQGNWGELVLERVLEKSGLVKDREYVIQKGFKTEDGKTVLPDVVINLPDNKRMIIDSKVSLSHYEQYVNADDEREKDMFLKAHINSIYKHVEQLSLKNYHHLYDIASPDFVLLFIPIEPAFAVTVSEDNNIYNKAFEKNIVIVTPTTLLATLRTIDSMWNNEKQQQNAIEIATQAGRLYDTFVSLTDELLKVGSQMGTVQKSYEGVMIKLTGKGNLIKRVETLKQLGAKSTKQQNEKLLNRASEND